MGIYETVTISIGHLCICMMHHSQIDTGSHEVPTTSTISHEPRRHHIRRYHTDVRIARKHTPRTPFEFGSSQEPDWVAGLKYDFYTREYNTINPDIVVAPARYPPLSPSTSQLPSSTHRPVSPVLGHSRYWGPMSRMWANPGVGLLDVGRSVGFRGPPIVVDGL